MWVWFLVGLIIGCASVRMEVMMMWFKKSKIRTYKEDILEKTKKKVLKEIVIAINEENTEKAEKWLDIFDKLDRFYYT